MLPEQGPPAGAAHFLLVQVPLQHCLFFLHLPPTDLHAFFEGLAAKTFSPRLSPTNPAIAATARALTA